ncbi:MAG: hypothetical protein PGN13_00360 [Patulibacter minatonensis]
MPARSLSRRGTLVGAALIATSLLGSATAASAASSIAYLDGKEVWVANLDGSSKTRLSGGEGDWTAVAQNDAGWIVGVELEAGKIATLSRFKIWDPQGVLSYQGPLANKPSGASAAYPLGLSLTAGGGLIVYGFSEFTYGYPVGSLATGFYALPSSTVVSPALGPLRVTRGVYATVGPNDRVVVSGFPNRHTIAFQAPDSIGSDVFTPWLDISGFAPNAIYNAVDLSGDGATIVSQVEKDVQGSDDPAFINIAKTESFGGAYVDDCMVDIPETAKAQHPTVSPDGRTVAWDDTSGVRIAGAPNLAANGPALCALTSPIATISATGSYPSIGGFDLNAYLAAKSPAPTPTPAPGGGGPAPTPTPVVGGPAAPTEPTFTLKTSGTPKVSTGAATATFKITPGATGTAKVTLTISPKSIGLKGKAAITLGTGSSKVTKGKSATVKVKLSAKAKTYKKRLKGKKATLKVQIGSSTVTTTIKLG